MDGDLRLFPLWPTLTGDMLLRPAHPVSPTVPYYISLSQIAEFVGGTGGGGGGGNASITVAETPPLYPLEGQLWWDSSDGGGQLYLWFDNYWVPATNQPGPQGPPGPAGGGSAYSLITPTTGQTIALDASDKTILNPAGALGSLTLTLPAGDDGQAIRITTRQRIDALAVTAPASAVDWVTGELPQNGILSLTYILALNAWVRG